jgi:translation elongation factor EF-Ts
MVGSSAQDLKKLRDATGAGLIDCKKALDEAEGNFEKALQIISKDSKPQRDLEAEIKASKDETLARKKVQYLENQKITKIASVESEIEMLKREISEIKKAHNALIAALEKAAADEKNSAKNPRVQTVVYGTYFLGDFSG